MKLDKIDHLILRKLQANGRITNAQLSSEIGLSPAPTLERVKKLEQANIIQSYHATINAEKLGLGIISFIEISLHLHKNSNIDEFTRQISQIPEVVECYHITGGADFLLKVYSENIAAYQKLLVEKISKVSGIGQMESKVVLATIKKEMVLPTGEAVAP